MGSTCSKDADIAPFTKEDVVSATSSDSVQKPPTSTSTPPDDLSRQITDTWKRIERTVAGAVYTSPPADAPLDRTVRVFVSSTFVDMHSERDVIVKQVMPTVRQFCAAHSLRLCDVDLRWGVPAGTDSLATIDICMRELHKCLTSGGGFFVGLLGGRYGWVPSTKDFDLDDGGGRSPLVEQYTWLEDISITHMEMLHGAYREANPNAIFMMRADESYNGVPAEHLERINDKGDMDRAQMKELKARLRRKFPRQCYDYAGKYDGYQEGRVRFSHLDSDRFATKLSDSLIAAITRHYRLTKGTKDKMVDGQPDIEDKLQAHFMASQLTHFVGRRHEQTDIQQLINTNLPNNITNAAFLKSDQALRLDDKDNNNRLVRRIVWLAGESGIGKSAVLAKICANHERKPGNAAFYHHCDASEQASSVEHLLHRLSTWLSSFNKDKDTSKSDDQPAGQSGEQSRQRLHTLLNATDRRTKLIIALDGVDKLSNYASTAHLDWLPLRTPDHVTLLVACADDDVDAPTAHRVTTRAPIKYGVGALSKTDRHTLIESYMTDYGKRLDEEQIVSLQRANTTDSLTWLHMAMDELRVYGNFRTVTDYIRRMPPQFDALAAMCMQRLTGEDSENRPCKLILSLITADTGAMHEDKLRHLLAASSSLDPKPSTFPQSHYVATLSTMLPFVRTAADGRLTVAHTALARIVDAQMTDADRSRVHALLYDYYEQGRASMERPQIVAHAIPWHAIKAGRRVGAIKFMKQDRRANMMSMRDREQITKLLRCTNRITGGGANAADMSAHVCVFCAPHMTSMRACVFCKRAVGGSATNGGGKPTMCTEHTTKMKTRGPFCILCDGVIVKGKTGHPIVICDGCRIDDHHRQMCAVIPK